MDNDGVLWVKQIQRPSWSFVLPLVLDTSEANMLAIAVKENGGKRTPLLVRNNPQPNRLKCWWLIYPPPPRIKTLNWKTTHSVRPFELSFSTAPIFGREVGTFQMLPTVSFVHKFWSKFWVRLQLVNRPSGVDERDAQKLRLFGEKVTDDSPKRFLGRSYKSRLILGHSQRTKRAFWKFLVKVRMGRAKIDYRKIRPAQNMVQ